ncbi:MAG: hypothetical protein ACM3UR_00825 [Bacteroidota bacterium]|jgi:hypothetical protein|nr:hypothetical protein [Ignavibacteria bacterium]MCU7497797.1 hypothetical protein [Ignavibacteria bacterium]MCU7511078.1 hypothetical protein [Ignavibacteria bacterium]MCU7518625.1 hypothetical protein [Ignavibacteria bacterium]MCU7522972.1 hypothetical protein [Ignavibacteria bacterium]
MKKGICSILLFTIMLTLTSCYSERFVNSQNNLNEVKDSDIIVSVETNDGRLIMNERPNAVYKSDKGLYVVDTTGTKVLPYKDVKSVKIKEVSYFKTASLVAGASLIGNIVLFVTSFHGFQ